MRSVTVGFDCNSFLSIVSEHWYFHRSIYTTTTDAIRHVTGGIKVARRQLVRMEVRTDKFEKKALAFSACRLFIVNAKSPFKVRDVTVIKCAETGLFLVSA